MSEINKGDENVSDVDLYQAYELVKSQFNSKVGELVLSILDPENEDRIAAHQKLDAVFDGKKPFTQLHKKVQATQSRNLFSN